MSTANLQKLQQEITKAVKEQIAANIPPETKETFERLLTEGYSESEARELIACAMTAELYDILDKKRTFNMDAYIANLRALPKLPQQTQPQ